MCLDLFHSSVQRWFGHQFDAPTEPQRRAWPLIATSQHTLIAAPTGSGKTLAAFLSAINDLVNRGVHGQLEQVTYVVYVSPLKALSNDIQHNLQGPLAGIQDELRGSSLNDFQIRTWVRTGDTSAKERAAMRRQPPHIVVTTPESLYLLLTSEGGRCMLRSAQTLIVDEIHSMIEGKRGSHLALSMERLEALIGKRLQRIGLSATQTPIEEVARFLVGQRNILPDGSPDCKIVDSGHRRKLDVGIELPESPLTAVMSLEVWQEIYNRLELLVQQHRTTLIFVNTRRMAERVCRHLDDRIGSGLIGTHHGSLSKEKRLAAEQDLKTGKLKALVATASLELGIDIGDVDLVCQLGSTRSISTFLQRTGRSGHSVSAIPKGRLFPFTRDELVESAALLDSIRRGELDRLKIPVRPLDILAQQIVAAVACEEWDEEQLYQFVRQAHPYQDLSRKDFDDVLHMLAGGFSTRLGRRGSYIHHDRINDRLRARRGARLAALTSGGAIPDTADYEVLLEPSGTHIGSVNEDFAIESMAGDIFQLGNASWKILRVEPGRVRVEDAHGQPPSIPFWFGEAPGRSDELSASVSRLRKAVAEKLSTPDCPLDATVGWLIRDFELPAPAAQQIAEYLYLAKRGLGAVPTQDTLVMERFFDESGGMQLVIHAPLGSRINRAWGLALRKRFCRKFNFELQAAATEDAIVLSLGHTHSFPLEEVFDYLRSHSVRSLLTQAVLDSPMFTVRWRWNASRALAVLRWRGGRRVAPQIQRMNAEDLVAAVFPDQLACAENLTGEREIPDHPLVRQTVRDCLEEAMDVRGLERLLKAIERGERRLVARDLVEPSPMAAEILSARPYAFLDDAPLEERRTQAVYGRRWQDPEKASDLGQLDGHAIERVRAEVWPQVETADELHDALMQLGFLTEEEGRTKWPVFVRPFRAELAESQSPRESPSWEKLFSDLESANRVARVTVRSSKSGEHRLWVAAERLSEFATALPNIKVDGAAELSPIEARIVTTRTCFGATPSEFNESPVENLVGILRSRLEGTGPTTTEELASLLSLPADSVGSALLQLEAQGFILRGKFTPGVAETEWCVRHLLARIHRYTVDRLRREIEPVPASNFISFLLDWQTVTPDRKVEGPIALSSVLEQLEGYEAPAAAWEAEILPARMTHYDPTWLDALCSSGKWCWLRLSTARIPGGTRHSGPISTTPIAFVQRRNLALWTALRPLGSCLTSDSSRAAQTILSELQEHGALFFADLVERTRILHSQLEDGLGELVSSGLVTADSFSGLRALLTPSSRRPPIVEGKRRKALPAFGIEEAGRWTLIGRTERMSSELAAGQSTWSWDAVAWTLLRRYGVIVRRALDREDLPWRDLLQIYRRLEARGEIRGGRFVAGFSGEQFALAEAVGLLRSIRRSEKRGTLVSVSAADPLNLAGIVTPGERVSTTRANRILYRDGVPIAIREAGHVRFTEVVNSAEQWNLRNSLIRRPTPPKLRSYLGNPA